jgi:hypothetical protein
MKTHLDVILSGFCNYTDPACFSTLDTEARVATTIGPRMIERRERGIEREKGRGRKGDRWIKRREIG